MTRNFVPATATYAPGYVPLATSPVMDEQVISANGAITLFSGAVHITKAGVCATTIPIPDQDGQRLLIVADTAYAHTVTTVSPGFNKDGGTLSITFSGTAGDSCEIESYDGAWWIVKATGTISVSYRGTDQVLSADGAITAKNGTCTITKTSACAATLAAPTSTTDDGALLKIVSNTAYAHTITQASPGFNAGSPTVITLEPYVGASVILVAYQGYWLVLNSTHANIGYPTKQAITGDGAITVKDGYVVLSKGSAAAITLAAPTSGTDDGAVLRVVAISAQAHVITSGTDGFNAKGSSGTATFGGAIGDSVTLIANGGHWYTLSKTNVTIA